MGSCDELASRIVALGVGRRVDFDIPADKKPIFYAIGDSPALSADDFVRDGRVILALIKMVRQRGMSYLLHTMPDGKAMLTIQEPIANGEQYADPSKRRSWAAQIVDDEDEIAIATACCEALENE